MNPQTSTPTQNSSPGSVFAYEEEQYTYLLDATTNTATVTTALDQLILTQESSPPANALSVAAGHNLVVYADTVIITGLLSLSGQTVSIYARVVGSALDAAGNAATIDVSGKAGSAPDPASIPADSPASNGTNGYEGDDVGVDGTGGSPGNTGTSGATGNPGTPAGTITVYTESFQAGTALTLNANGGAGGAAENGQPGQQGGNGGQGYQGPSNPYGEDTSSNGGSGGPGGPGGSGGTGGAGAAAGTITVGAVVQVTGPSLVVNALGGAGAAGGDAGAGGTGGSAGASYNGGDPSDGSNGGPGNGGNGGDGGNGGLVVTTAFLAAAVTVTYGAGGTGNAGLSGGSGGIGGTGGMEGSSTTAAVTYADLSANVSAAQCSMLLEKAKLLYLTADPANNPAAYGTVATLLQWLLNVTAAFTGTSPAVSSYSADDTSVLAAIYSQAAGLLMQLTLRRDFYGNLPSYVPQGSYSFYQTQLSTMLGTTGTFTAIENNYLTYIYYLQQQTDSTAPLTSAQTQDQGQLSVLEGQSTTAFNNANALAGTITDDESSVQAQYLLMTSAISGLENQLALLAGANCVFSSLIQGLGLVAAVSGDGDIAQAQSIAQNASDLLTPAVTGLLGIGSLPTLDFVTQLDVLGQDVTTLNEGYTASQSVVTPADPNAYKLLAAQADLTTALTPYLSLNGIQADLDVVNEYVTRVLQLNADILAYNTNVAQLAAIQAQVQQNTAQLSIVEAQLAANASPGLAALVAFMVRDYHDARAQVLYTIYMANRALAFWSLTAPQNFAGISGLTDPTGINAGTLNTALQSLVVSMGKAVENFGTTAQAFPADEGGTTYPQGIVYTLTKAQNPGLFTTLTTLNTSDTTNFPQGIYEVSFAIPAALVGTAQAENPFFGKANVRLTIARPWLHGAVTTATDSSGQNVLTVSITHTGTETLVDQNSNPYVFSHDPVTANFEFEYANIYDPSSIQQDAVFDADSSSTATTNVYAQPGPFTTWKIQVNPAYNAGLDMSNVDSLTLEFWGSSYAFNSAAVK